MTGRSSIRNKVIAAVCERLDLVEGWGTGIKRIIELCAELKIQPPEFMEISDMFRVNFYRPSYAAVETTGKTNVQENVQEKSREDVIIGLITENERISIKEIAEKLGVTSKTVQRDMDKLKERNRIQRTGADKGGHWEVLK